MSYKLSSVLLFLGLLLAACDGGSSSAQGYTPCGSVTCQPGQYCGDARFSSCVDGCLSNDNCAADQVCDTDAFIAACVNSTVAPMTDAGTPVTVDALAACQAACDHFQTCGLGAGPAASCRTDCGGLTEDQQRAVGNCGSVACTTVTTCLGVSCLNDDDCGAGQSCLGFECL